MCKYTRCPHLQGVCCAEMHVRVPVPVCARVCLCVWVPVPVRVRACMRMCMVQAASGGRVHKCILSRVYKGALACVH